MPRGRRAGLRRPGGLREVVGWELGDATRRWSTDFRCEPAPTCPAGRCEVRGMAWKLTWPGPAGPDALFDSLAAGATGVVGIRRVWRRSAGPRQGSRASSRRGMMRSARQKLHLRVATTLRERFPEVEGSQPDLLAQHFEHGGDLERAVAYWARAGDGTMSRGAYAEAIRVFERGLTLVTRLPDSRQRSRAAAARPGQAGRCARAARPGARLVHRGARHARPPRGGGAPRRAPL